MKTNLSFLFIFLMITLTACQTTVPTSPLLATKGFEIILAANQTVSIVDTDLVIRLIGVTSDERCPSEIECAASGPVSISLSIQNGDEEPSNIDLQTFTDNNGRAPDFQFEKIKNPIAYEGYLIRVTAVLPYPANLGKPIKSSAYRVSLTVTHE